jgi:hypothetical protein
MMHTPEETDVRRLSAALAEVSKPLLPLLEYAGDLEKRAQEGDSVGLTCIAALLRARAAAAKREIAASLQAVEDAAHHIVCN